MFGTELRASKTLEVCVLSAMGNCALSTIANRVVKLLADYRKSKIVDIAAYFGKLLDSTFELGLASKPDFH